LRPSGRTGRTASIGGGGDAARPILGTGKVPRARLGTRPVPSGLDSHGVEGCPVARDPSRAVGEPRRGAALVRLQGNHDECGQGLDRDRLTGRGESGIRGAGVRMGCPDWCRSRCLALSLRCSLTRNGACFLPRTWRGHQTRKMPPAPMRYRGRRSFWGCVFLGCLVGGWCRQSLASQSVLSGWWRRVHPSPV